MTTVSVRLPNGKTGTADLGGSAGSGYRRAYVRVTDSLGQRVRIAGRVTNRHGFTDGRTLPFEVNMQSINALDAFEGVEGDLFVRS